MHTSARRFCVTLLPLIAIALPSDAHSQSSMPAHGFQVGTAFPTLSLPSLHDGRPASISDFRGQKVILHIFASW